MRLGKLILAGAVALASFASSPALASDKDDVLAVLKQFSAPPGPDGKSGAALCTDDAVVIDMVPPFSWRGPGACSAWMRDIGADSKKNGISYGAVTVGQPASVIISGDYAYVSAPTALAYKQNGAEQAPMSAIWTLAFRRLPEGWRISGLAWGLK